jgi:hypothetical protein
MLCVIMLSVEFSNCYAECQVFLLIVLSVISHSVSKLIVIKLIVIMMSVIMQSVIKLSVIMLIVVMPAHNNPDNHKQVVALWVTVNLSNYSARISC